MHPKHGSEQTCRGRPGRVSCLCLVQASRNRRSCFSVARGPTVLCSPWTLVVTLSCWVSSPAAPRVLCGTPGEQGWAHQQPLLPCLTSADGGFVLFLLLFIFAFLCIRAQFHQHWPLHSENPVSGTAVGTTESCQPFFGTYF